MPPSTLPPEEQLALLMRGAEYGDDLLRAQMHAELDERLGESARTGRPLRVYLGVDPTSSDLHLGHTVPLRKLQQFQALGHQAIFLIGSFTGLIGDPSDKESARPQQTAEQVAAHAQTYVEQVYRVLDRASTLIEYNDRWLSKLTFADAIELASHFTVQQFLKRDNFGARLAAQDPIWLHEFFYGLMQAYDAVALRADVQIGGTEQLFNLMAGRKLMEAQGLRPQVCLTLPILPGTDGHQRMSKTTGNTIGIAEASEVQFAKVMSIPDTAMRTYAELVTTWTPADIAVLWGELESGKVHPRDAKMRLAGEIVTLFHGASAAERAKEHFRTVFQERDLPPDMRSYALAKPTNIVSLLVAAGLALSNSEARRLIAQGGVRLDGVAVDDIEAVIEPRGQVLQVGRRRHVRLT